ncbi:hypothetical protein GCM10027605_48490 [Micromonospora zhanjiangensis]
MSDAPQSITSSIDRLPYRRNPDMDEAGGSTESSVSALPSGGRISQEHLPHWQLCPDFGLPIFSASLHQAHFDRPALIHAQPIVAPIKCGSSLPN